MKKQLGAIALALAVQAQTASAFCGFYVSGSGDKMFNDATQVVLVRDGTRTVLSMQNDYKGPLQDFAMVIPVPVVLHDVDVKTLPKDVFDHVDALGSPRLVEYWEQDPCPRPEDKEDDDGAGMDRRKAGRAYAPAEATTAATHSSVKVEAQFAVGEYQIVILSAKDSTGLDSYLRDNHYKIPDGAEPLLRPYVEAGMKFFVAKVDPNKVQMVDGHAALSPLRFFYDSDEFSLPVRLGMANSSGTQDLIVNIISADKRYEVANYKNVFIPTNFDVKDTVKQHFGEFYTALFDKTIEANPRAVVTEYAWTAVPNYHCDPCTNADVSNPDLMTVGGDVVGGQIARGTFVLTRLHARYGKSDMTDDLRFREAKAVTGGREIRTKDGLEYGAVPSDQNYFQARYAVRHYWTGAISCQSPQRGVWGGPPDGNYQPTIAANKIAFAPRGQIALEKVIGRDLWEIGFKKGTGFNRAPQNNNGNGNGNGGGGGGGFAKPPPGHGASMMGFGVASALVTIGVLLGITRRRKR